MKSSIQLPQDVNDKLEKIFTEAEDTILRYYREYENDSYKMSDQFRADDNYHTDTFYKIIDVLEDHFDDDIEYHSVDIVIGKLRFFCDGLCETGFGLA